MVIKRPGNETLSQDKNEKYLLNAFPNEKIATFITEALAQVYDGRVQTWDYPYGFSLLVNNGLTVVPNANLITNLGFDALATRTSDRNSIHANIPTESLGEIIHSEVSFPNIEADLFSCLCRPIMSQSLN